MKHLLLLLPLLLLAACARETRVVRDNSASTKFASMFGGHASAGGETSGAFQMTRGGVTTTPGAPAAEGQASAQAMEIARILRTGGGGAGQQLPRENPGNVKVITSFQTDEPRSPSAPADPNAPTKNLPSFLNPQPAPAQ